jgi:hypothetical protein
VGKFLIGNADRYEIFFGTLALVLFSLFASAIKHLIIDGEGGAVIFPFATLFAVIFVVGLAKQPVSAKELFWTWIGLTVGLTAVAFLGDFIIWVFR